MIDQSLGDEKKLEESWRILVPISIVDVDQDQIKLPKIA